MEGSSESNYDFLGKRLHAYFLEYMCVPLHLFVLRMISEVTNL
jgi:hypothetical protein